MKQSGRRLNLAPHICGRQRYVSFSSFFLNFPFCSLSPPHLLFRSSLKRLWSAADVEGHLGLDGQFYLLDFSRTLPPTHPDPKKRLPHLYEMFRSEVFFSFVFYFPKQGGLTTLFFLFCPFLLSLNSLLSNTLGLFAQTLILALLLRILLKGILIM